MRAVKVFEKFTEKGDPVHDMGIGLMHKFKEMKKLLEKIADEDVNAENLEFDKEEYTIRLDVLDVLDLDEYSFKGNDWRGMQVYNSFSLNYYIDVILPKNELVRSWSLTNNDIPDFEYWSNKVLCNNVMGTPSSKIYKLIVDDYVAVDSSSEFVDAFKEAWETAEVDNEKTQKRISSY